MPVMNGLEAARALKLLMHLVPLLLFTNTAGEILKKDALAAGIFAVVYKSDSDASKQLVAHARALLDWTTVGRQWAWHPTDKNAART
jgi:CheY-like chemotaxis protein